MWGAKELFVFSLLALLLRSLHAEEYEMELKRPHGVNLLMQSFGLGYRLPPKHIHTRSATFSVRDRLRNLKEQTKLNEIRNLVFG